MRIKRLLKTNYSIQIRMDNKQEITSKLKFIGKLKNGEKINTRHMYVQPDGLGTSFSRTFLYQDNRINALEFIRDTITRAFDLLAKYERSTVESHKVHYNLLVKDLRNATKGIGSLKITYKTDTKFCCDMDTILEHIHANLVNVLEEDTEEDEDEDANEES